MEYDDNYSISISWCVEDIKEVNENLTKEQAIKVLNHLGKNHDASIGINWDVIENTINALYGDI